MRETKPLIGVTGPDEGGAAAWWFCRLAVCRAGGRAVRISPSKPVAIDSLDGIVMGGGADVDPALYGKKKIELAMEVIRKKRSLAYTATRIFFYPLIYFARKLASSKTAPEGDEKRDALEYRLIEKALEKGIPILGICRGAQLINVVSGGTLYQDLSQFYLETPQYHSVFPRKTVMLLPGSRLSRICKSRRMRVNALHRQAIDRTGKNIRIAGAEPNGVVQAIEHEKKAVCRRRAMAPRIPPSPPCPAIFIQSIGSRRP